MDLVKILGHRQTVGIHSHVTDPQQSAVTDLALDGEIPLRGLGIAEQWVVGLVQRAAAKNRGLIRRRGGRELKLRLAANIVGVGVNHREWIACIVEGHWTESRDGENSEACAEHGLVVAERTERQADARIEIAR